MKLNIPDYLRLFIRREGKIVLGRHYSNVWLLTAVLVSTFLAIAFANGSLNYLNFKMNDPFIKWVDIKNENNGAAFERLEQALGDSTKALQYHYRSYSYDYEYSYYFFGAADSVQVYLKCRFFDVDNKDLIEAILDAENRVVGLEPEEVPNISDNSLGVFLTEKTLGRMGYKQAPAYIDLYQFSPGAEELGFTEVNRRVRVPVPVLGVVRRLPGSVDLVAFTNLYRQKFDEAKALNMNNEAYASSLCYFIPEEVDAVEFDGRLQELLEARTEASFLIDDQSFDPKELYSYKNRVTEVDEDGYTYHYLGFRQVFVTDTLTLTPAVCAEVNRLIMDEFGAKGVRRIFRYDYSTSGLPTGDYLSIHFDDLKMIKPFAEEVVNACELEIEMSQINAKENFHSVSVMAITLSVVMVIFAVICILLFITNLLQSYFQKVKRNIGTFKAFGISNQELRRVYMTIMLSLVGISVAISLIFVGLVQALLPVFNIVKGEGFGYLSLWRCDVIHAFPSLICVAAVVIVLVSASVTVRIVMNNLLSATPGDLIYDR